MEEREMDKKGKELNILSNTLHYIVPCILNIKERETQRGKQ